MRYQRILRAFTASTTCVVLAVSCGGGNDGGSANPAVLEDGADARVIAGPVYGGEVVVGLEAEATGLRPWEDGCISSCLNIIHSIFDVLMQQNAGGEYEGFLAEGIRPNEDFTVWTMTLRPGVTFSDGTPLTAQTIADMFPIQQTGAVSGGLVAASGLVAVAATAALEVTYRLSAPNSAFPAFLTTAALGAPFLPDRAASDPSGYSRNPIGTGPFTLASRDRDNETVVVRRDDYWRRGADGNALPYLDRVRFRPIPDEGARLDSLLSGTVDAMQSLRQGTVRDARSASGIRLVEHVGNNIGGGVYNTAAPPLDDVRVRAGLNRMIDQDRVIEALGGAGISLPGTQWFAPDSPYWTQAAADTHLGFDFQAGKAALQQYVDDPGRSDGRAPGEPIDIELSCMPDPTLTAAMQVIEQVWSGSELVDVRLIQHDQATLISHVLSDRHFAACARGGGESDPALDVNSYVGPPELSALNLTNFDSPTIQRAARAATRTDDFEERRALYSQIMQEFNTEAIHWYSGHTMMMIAVQENVHGVGEWTLPSGTRGNGIALAVTLWSEVFVVQ